jgi:hypothetical protein
VIPLRRVTESDWYAAWYRFGRAAEVRIPAAFDAAGDVLIRRPLRAVEAGMRRLWNGFMAVPGIRRTGEIVATGLGLYRLDAWLTRRERERNLRLAETLEQTGVPCLVESGRALRAATERRSTR